MVQFVWLTTDCLLWALIVCLLFYVRHVRHTPPLIVTWRKVFARPVAMSMSVILLVFLIIAMLDSIHFRRATITSGANGQNPTQFSQRVESVLDVLLDDLVQTREKTYSAPLAWQGFTKESMERNGSAIRDYPRLRKGGAHLKNPETEWTTDVLKRAARGLAHAILATMLCAVFLTAALAQNSFRHTRSAAAGAPISHAWRALWQQQTALPWRAALVTLGLILAIVLPIIELAPYYHVFGTDKVGADLLYLALKSIRTALVIGLLTTLITLPLAIVLGVCAGYFKGWIDDVIQYVYTTLNSVPDVLLIAASVLMLQVFIDTHAELFPTSAERADVRLFFLCVILGVTSWTGLCRLLRAETLKLREQDFVLAARAFGVSHARILARHIVPNIMHIILISVVMDFSKLVLAEAVLSYVGVGVDPSTTSFGTMINAARLELAREPMVWWSLATAFSLMFALVLAANLLADEIRAAFDPRASQFRPQRANLGQTGRSTAHLNDLHPVRWLRQWRQHLRRTQPSKAEG